jgi:hypothetical protein
MHLGLNSDPVAQSVKTLKAAAAIATVCQWPWGGVSRRMQSVYHSSAAAAACAESVVCLSGAGSPGKEGG